MKNGFLVFFFLGILSACVVAVSSQEAVIFVVKESSYLIEGENFKTPVATISDGRDEFWVVPVLSGTDVITYFPVKVTVKELSSNRAKNRELFRVAALLQGLSAEKDRVSKSNSVDWVFTSSYVLLFNTLSNSLDNETFQLNTIASTLNDRTVNSSVADLKQGLSLMSERSSNISLLVNQAVSAEASFNSKPSVVKVNDLKQKFDAVFLELSKLNEEALSYRSEINRLKEFISKTGNDPSTKTYLIQLSDPPQEFNSIGNYVLDSTEVSSGIDSVYSKVNSSLDIFLDTFELRLKRNQSFLLLYGKNESVVKTTNEKNSSLRELVVFILSEQNRPFWKEQSSLVSLESNWNAAERAFNEQNYQNSDFLGKKALSDAVRIYSIGYIDIPDQKPLLSQETIFSAVVFLAVLFLLIFAYNNREKIASFARPPDGKKEVEFDGF